jgi:hypothetical protein
MGRILLLDTSGSMVTPVGSRRRIDVLADILAAVFPALPDTRLFGFGSTTTELVDAVTEHGINLPEPAGSTALHLALEAMMPLKPNPLVIISDGEPDDAHAAIAQARLLGCVITTYYVGDESDRAATAFLRDLSLCSRGGVGRASRGDLLKPEQLAADIRLRLTGPARWA